MDTEDGKNARPFWQHVHHFASNVVQRQLITVPSRAAAHQKVMAELRHNLEVIKNDK